MFIIAIIGFILAILSMFGILAGIFLIMASISAFSDFKIFVIGLLVLALSFGYIGYSLKLSDDYSWVENKHIYVEEYNGIISLGHHATPHYSFITKNGEVLNLKCSYSTMSYGNKINIVEFSRVANFEEWKELLFFTYGHHEQQYKYKITLPKK